jgi:hypothetical protein
MLLLDNDVKVRNLTQKSPFKSNLKGLFKFYLLCFCEASGILELRNRNQLDVKN